MAVWMVRAGDHGQDEDFALEKGIAVIGWDEVGDLSRIPSRDDMRALLEECYPGASKNKISNFLGQLWAFAKRIEIGDTVVLPLKTRSVIAVGMVEGDYEYHAENGSGRRHSRKVRWTMDELPRTDLAQDLLYSLGALMTVCQIRRNNAENRIKAILDGGKDPNLGQPAAPSDTGEEGQDGGQEPPLDLESYARDQIRSYIDAEFKGHEFTRLVNAVLRAQGFHTYVSPAGPDGGVDIIAGQGTMGFGQPRLCVQVKSGGSPEGVTTLRELQGVMNNFGAEQGLLVSWGGFKDTVYKEARTLFFEVRLWDADRFIDAVFEHYDDLADEIQAELPLKRVWALVLEE